MAKIYILESDGDSKFGQNIANIFIFKVAKIQPRITLKKFGGGKFATTNRVNSFRVFNKTVEKFQNSSPKIQNKSDFRKPENIGKKTLRIIVFMNSSNFAKFHAISII